MAGRVAPWRRGGTSVTIRDAAPADAEAVCRIENQGIEDRVATLETELRTPAERREWMASRGPRHPVLVAEIDGAITGWGFGAPGKPVALLDVGASLIPRPRARARA